jgi:hypothetical protein
MKFAGPYEPVSLKETIVPRKKGTFAKVTEVVTDVSETVKNVGEIVEGIAETVSEVAQTIRQTEEKPPQKKVARKAQPAATARAKPQPKTKRAFTGTQARTRRKKTTKR